MKPILKNAALLTDLYQLTMMQSYFVDDRSNDTASFYYFFRKIPYNGGYVIFAGLNEILNQIESLIFTDEDLTYLKKIGFRPDFLNYLDAFSFRGNIHSMKEGSLVFPNEPIMSVNGNLIECQLVETILLNTINFNSLIATKAARIRMAAGEKVLGDFGLRRSHGLGGIQASHAAVIGGFNSTSNVFAANKYDLNPVGTMAHSYIQSYDEELTAFRIFAKSNPDNVTILIDTYDTINSGLKNAITVAKELEENGNKLKAVRLDSGDLKTLSKQVRKELDNAGLDYVKIVASNQLDEFVITELLNANSPIDIFGVGTNLVTGQPDSALDGVYKLAMVNDKPSIKLSENEEKITLPGLKQVHRKTDKNGNMLEDIISLHNESIEDGINSNDRINYSSVKMLNPVMEKGKITLKLEVAGEIQKRVKNNLDHFDEKYKRLDSPEVYKVSLSKELEKIRNDLINSTRKKIK